MKKQPLIILAAILGLFSLYGATGVFKSENTTKQEVQSAKISIYKSPTNSPTLTPTKSPTPTQAPTPLPTIIPTYVPTEPITSYTESPTAQCVDGSYSYAANHRGACSHHGGVSRWLR